MLKKFLRGLLFFAIFCVLIIVITISYLYLGPSSTFKTALGNGYYKNIIGVYAQDSCSLSQFIGTSCARFRVKRIIGVDKKTFVPIIKQQPLGANTGEMGLPGLGKDKNHLYIFGNIIPNIDAASFKQPGWGYFTDIDGVYYRNQQTIPSAYSSAFKARDFINFQLEKIASNDGALAVTENFAKNKTDSFYQGKKISAGKAEYFKPVNGCFWKDDKNLYTEITKGIPMPADIPSLQTISGVCEIVKDKEHVYSWSGIIPEADPKTFTTWGVISKDANHVFLRNQIIAGTDAKTFTAISQSFFKDKNQAYYSDSINFTILTGVDPASLKVDKICQDYFTDKNSAYYYHSESGKFTKIEGSDPKTFTGFVGEVDHVCYAKDKNHTYFRGNIK